MIINKGPRGHHLPGWIQKSLHGLVTQQPQTPSNPRAQEGRVSWMEQEEFSSVEVPSTSPTFVW